MGKSAQNSQNMQLDQPRVLLPEGGQLRKWFIYAVVLALGGLGSWGCVITAFEIRVYPAALVAAGLVCCGFCVWRQVDSRKRWWSVSLAGWILWLLILVFQFDNAAHGAVRVANTMLDCYGTKLNYDLPVFILPYTNVSGRPNVYNECTVFFALLQFPFFWASSHMWVRGRNALEVFALTGVLLMFPMSFSILPAGWAFGTLLLFWCTLLFIAPALSGREGLLGRKQKYRVSGAAHTRPGLLLVIPAIVLCMLLVYWSTPPEGYERPQLVDDLRTGLQEGFSSSPYLRGGQGNSNKRVQLNSMGTRSYTGETMLRVKFDWREDPLQPTAGAYDRLLESLQIEGEDGGTVRIDGRPVNINDAYSVPAANAFKEYLKSFVGTVYTGESWERLPVEEGDALNGIQLKAQNQLDRFRQEMFLASRDMSGAYTLSVENVGANPHCVYVPASLCSGPEDLAGYQMEFVDDGYLKSGNIILGTREYELDGAAWGYGGSYFSRVANVILRRDAFGMSLDGDAGSASIGNIMQDSYEFERYYNQMPGADFSALSALLDSLNTQAEEAGAGWPDDLWYAPPSVTQYLTEEEIALTSAVEDYNQFVYQHYTQVPEELADYLDRFREAFDLNPGRRDMTGDFRYKDGAQFFADEIAQVFRTYYTYTLDPAMPGEGQDFVEFFLDQSHEGFCVHFASAAVLLLRSAGYPARYAEGYVVPSSEDGLWVDVPDYNAHAWVEVYCGGTGWIPVEVTPPSTDNPAVYYNATLPEEEDIPTPVPVEEMPTLPPRQETDHQRDPDMLGPTLAPRASASPAPAQNANGRAAGEDESFWPVMLGCVGALIGLVGLLLLNRLLRIHKRRKDLAQEDRSQAGLRAYAYLLKLYHWEALCGQRAQQPPRWKELAEKARFSRNMLSQEELAELTGDGERLADKLREQLPRFQKLKCWLAGLI